MAFNGHHLEQHLPSIREPGPRLVSMLDLMLLMDIRVVPLPQGPFTLQGLTQIFLASTCRLRRAHWT